MTPEANTGMPGLDDGSRVLSQLRPYVRQCGCSPRSPWHLTERRLLDFLIVYIDDGYGVFTVDGERYEATTGDLFWIPPGVLHEMQGDSPSMVVLYAHFDLLYRPELSHWDFSIPGGMSELGELEALMHPPVPPPLDRLTGRMRVSQAQRIGQRLRMVCDYAIRATPYAQVHMSAAILEIVALILDEQEMALKPLIMQHQVCMEETARYIRDHYHEPLTVDALAARSGLATCYFRRLFGQAFGMSPHRYIVQFRLSHAKDLMLHTSMTLSEIAVQTGFSSIHNFSRAFKKLEGIAPRDFRHAGRNVTVKVEGRLPCYSH